MATINEIVSHIYTNEASLATVPVKYGQLIICSDSEKLYIDKDRRISLGDLVIVETSDALPIAPLDKLYFTKDTNTLYINSNGTWVSINPNQFIDPNRLLPDTANNGEILQYYSNNEVGEWRLVPFSDLLADVTIDLSNYQQDSSISLTSTSGSISLSGTDLLFNGHASNTAGGIPVIGENGKLPNTLLDAPKVDLSNHVENSTIKLTSTAGAINLTANASEVALYSGSSYAKVNTSGVVLQGSTITFNGNQQNTTGGVVIVGDDGKIAASILPEFSGMTDLSNYVGKINLRNTEGTGATVSLEGGDFTVDVTSGEFRIGDPAGNVITTKSTTNKTTLQGAKGVILQNSSVASTEVHTMEIGQSGLLYDGHALNQANGLVQLTADKKIPEELIPTTGSNVSVVVSETEPENPTEGMIWIQE